MKYLPLSVFSSFRAQKRLTLNEVLTMLEEDEEMMSATVYITPPGDGTVSDGDSGEEDEGTFQNLHHQQLLAEAEAVSQHPDGKVVVGDVEESLTAPDTESDSEPEDQPQQVLPTEEGDAPRQILAARYVRNRVRHQQLAARNWRQQDLPRNSLPAQQPWPHITSPAFLNQEHSPVELFEFFFDEEVIAYLVDQTNLYASRDMGDHNFTTNNQDMKTFLAILLLSGYSALPRRRMYWEKSCDVRNEAVSSAMSRKRFEDHFRYLHLNDNACINRSDKLAKIRNFLVMINERCLVYFPVSRNLSIDESMIPYYGHHSSKQFIRGKPIRFGFKLWCLADPLGYIVQFEPYVGAAERYGSLGLGGSVVMDLIAELPEHPFHLTFDNFFTSFPLLTELAAKDIGATGTIRQNRLQQCPLQDAAAFGKRPRGSTDYCLDTTNNILVVQWNDNSIVRMASNCDSAFPLGQTRRWSRQQGKHVLIDQPDINRQYNATMGGVDRADQNINKYRISMRTKKWWWPFFAHTVEMALQNAWLLYRKYNASEPLDLLAFRRKIVQEYLQVGTLPCLPRDHPAISQFSLVSNKTRLDQKGHFSGDSTVQKRCAQCRRNTKKICLKCGIGLHLHCFNLYHGVS